MLFKLIITRFKETNDRTLGRFMLLDDEGNIWQEGYTLEPSGPDTTKPNQNKRIPRGVYKTIKRYSPRFKYKTPLLYSPDVDASRCILIHKGNYPWDTTGCILVGAEYDRYNGYVKNSTKAYGELENNVGDDELEVHIIGAYDDK